MINFRGVSKLCGFAIVVEKLMKNQLMFHLKNIIHNSQHGFMNARSTLTNLAEFVQRGSDVLDAGGQVDVIYFDAQKAFDQVPHEFFLQKCEKNGFSQNASTLMRSYITGRKYQVKLNGVTSRLVEPKSGVGQGSVMGPPSFLLFFNDLISMMECEGWSFADDFKCVWEIKTVDDTAMVQRDIDKVSQWCDNNGLRMNVSKCKVLTITKKKSPIVGNYLMNGTAIERVDKIRDLGIIIDKHLRFDANIDEKVRQA